MPNERPTGMRFWIAFIFMCLVAIACTSSAETTSDPTDPTAASTELDSTTGISQSEAVDCHPANDRADCVVAVVFLDEPISLDDAERLSADANAYLNALFRVDPVCVPKDFPFAPGTELGETLSRRTYWEAEQRLDRIASDRSAGLVPPVTMGGFDVVIDARMRAEWRFARMPGVEFYALVLWIDETSAGVLADRYTVETHQLGGTFGRYTHSEGRGEIRVDRDFEPPGALPAETTICGVPTDS